MGTFMEYFNAFWVGGLICAGASVPLLGFGHLLFQGVKDAVKESGFLGLFQGGLKAGAVGTSAALIFAYLASWIFQPKMKK